MFYHRKKFTFFIFLPRHANGLKYHQAHAHLDFDENDVSKDDVTTPEDRDGDERVTDSESGSKQREIPQPEKPVTPAEQVAMDTAETALTAPQVTAPKAPAPTGVNSIDRAGAKGQQGASPYARASAQSSVESLTQESKPGNDMGFVRSPDICCWNMNRIDQWFSTRMKACIMVLL